MVAIADVAGAVSAREDIRFTPTHLRVTIARCRIPETAGCACNATGTFASNADSHEHPPAVFHC